VRAARAAWLGCGAGRRLACCGAGDGWAGISGWAEKEGAEGLLFSFFFKFLFKQTNN
jgi:hypothetical protein